MRVAADLARLPRVDALIECSAEPSVLAGFDGPNGVVQTNLVGAWNCLAGAQGPVAGRVSVHEPGNIQSLI